MLLWLVQICGKYALHPHNEEAREQHSSECQARHNRLAALRYSQGVECCVCMERVLDKPTAAERKFGLTMPSVWAASGAGGLTMRVAQTQTQ